MDSRADETPEQERYIKDEEEPVEWEDGILVYCKKGRRFFNHGCWCPISSCGNPTCINCRYSKLVLSTDCREGSSYGSIAIERDTYPLSAVDNKYLYRFKNHIPFMISEIPQGVDDDTHSH